MSVERIASDLRAEKHDQEEWSSIPLRILLLNYEFPPLGGGASRATYCMAQELLRRGHTVDVLTSSATGRHMADSLDGARIFRVRSWRRGVHEAGLIGVASYLLFALFELRRLLKRNEYDVAHFFFALPTGALAFYWRYRAGKPYIVSLRGSDVPNYDPNHPVLRLLHALLRPLTRSILANAAHVVANSHSLRELALQSYPDLHVSVIPNAVDCRTYRPGPKPVFTGPQVQALSVARLVRRKGLETMLEALARETSRGIKLNIVGDGPLILKLKRLAVELGIDTRVAFLGALKGKPLWDAYQSADFFILPSLSESCSMSLLEAMASGLPVVASDTGGIPELVTAGQNGILVPPGNVAALSTAIGEMARSPLLREKLSENNRTKMLDHYSWRHIAAQYLGRCYLESRVDEVGDRPVEASWN